MRAIVADKSSIRFDRAVAVPEPAHGEALIRVTHCSVSQEDVPTIRHENQFEGVIGHEFVGIVERVAGEPEHPLVGKRVVGFAVTSCGVCELCRAGVSAHCRKRSIMGLSGRGGACAEYCVLPVANLCEIPQSLPDDHAVFSACVGSALHTVQQVRIAGRPFV
ncbi:MAG TPA: alcohol dehydrogenase catalytic domain-containing protein, partial [Phycisphaerales bacterium]|nr:alcohol dehydrogenase catalytic domain-containing protein [Phycisphaerales bacterium]